MTALPNKHYGGLHEATQEEEDQRTAGKISGESRL